MPLFDGYIAVDWSSYSEPKQNDNSIWIAIRDSPEAPRLKNPRTRQAAMEHINDLLNIATKKGRRLLCGFDFSFGYPEGTAWMLTGQHCWAAVWALIADVIEDYPNNRNNRFEAAAYLNQFFPGEGLFWGLPQGRYLDTLLPAGPRHSWRERLPPRLRHAEEFIRGAKEVWHLHGQGTVGGQALTGIARLERLRRCRNDIQVWPFETLGDGRSHVLAEIYPSLISPCPMAGINTKDERQVRAVAAALQELDRTGELSQHLHAPLNMPARVRREEGSILGMHDPEGFEAARQRVRPCC